MAGSIELTDLGCSFTRTGPHGAREEYTALSKVNLQVEAGEFFCLLGPSGCGKSTILRILAGFQTPSSGAALIDGQKIRGPGANRGVVFQSSGALFPWLTAAENVEFGLRMAGIEKQARLATVCHYMRLVGLEGFENNYPNELSGGMQQRIQIARVLANDPAILLMDEPFGALDAQTRSVMQDQLQQIWMQTGKTVFFITHDIEEAVLLGTRVGVMHAGPRSSIKMVRDVRLPRPRNPMDETLLRLRAELKEDLHGEALKAMRAVTQ